MKYAPPKSVRLSAEEQSNYTLVQNSTNDDDWDKVADAMQSLVESLLNRSAIPDVRLRLFCDPLYAEVGSKSRQQVFESNGTSGEDIYRHPHFIPYLNQFIRGPDLPTDAVDGFCKILNEDSGTSAMVLDQCRKYVRSSIRQHQLPPNDAATEFFRLAVELGVDLSTARSIRDAARNTR